MTGPARRRTNPTPWCCCWLDGCNGMGQTPRGSHCTSMFCEECDGSLCPGCGRCTVHASGRCPCSTRPDRYREDRRLFAVHNSKGEDS